MSPSVATFVFESVNFLLLAVFLGWLFFKPVREALQRESEERRRAEQQAKEKEDKAQALLDQAAQLRRGIDAELEQVRARQLARTRDEIETLKDAARRDQQSVAEQAERRLEAARRKQAKELAISVGQIAGEAVRQLLDQVNGPALDAALVRAACERLSGVVNTGGTALVEHARPLDEQSRRLLTSVLGEFRERGAPELGAGVRITTSEGQVDATATSFATQAASDVADRIELADGAE